MALPQGVFGLTVNAGSKATKEPGAVSPALLLLASRDYNSTNSSLLSAFK
jgi:hypothetical protein